MIVHKELFEFTAQGRTLQGPSLRQHVQANVWGAYIPHIDLFYCRRKRDSHTIIHLRFEKTVCILHSIRFMRAFKYDNGTIVSHQSISWIGLHGLYTYISCIIYDVLYLPKQQTRLIQTHLSMQSHLVTLKGRLFCVLKAP